MVAHTALTELCTRNGQVRFPTYIPVTTFGSRYPLDDLIRPYLRRLSQAVMVSLYYARQMEAHPGMPLLVDSGGFASLFDGASVKQVRGLGVLERSNGEETELLHPTEVLEFQEEHADVAFTLDFPSPPRMSVREAARRQKLTLANAEWASENRRRRDLVLYGCVQGWDTQSYEECARQMVKLGVEGIAIGGLVPRMKDPELMMGIVRIVREAVTDRPVHVFGIGRPDLVKLLYAAGVQSVDSSSYVRLAADGRIWGDPGYRLKRASQTERLHLALCNLAAATQATLPLASTPLVFRTHTLFTDVRDPAQG